MVADDEEVAFPLNHVLGPDRDGEAGVGADADVGVDAGEVRLDVLTGAEDVGVVAGAVESADEGVSGTALAGVEGVVAGASHEEVFAFLTLG